MSKVQDELKRANTMELEGPFGEERHRLKEGMTDADRAYRNQYLKDQILAPDEPRRVPELELALKNPIRRLYGKPWDLFIDVIRPAVGAEWAASLRYHLPKCAMGIAILYGTFYYFKYNASDWTRYGGWRVRSVRPKVYPGHPEYPKTSDRHEPADYYSRGFKDRKVFLDCEC